MELFVVHVEDLLVGFASERSMWTALASPYCGGSDQKGLYAVTRIT